MCWKRILKSILLPRNVLLAAAPFAVNKSIESGKTAIRPSELPVYVDEVTREVVPKPTNDEASAFEQAVGSVRRELCSFASEVNDVSNKASKVVKENWEASIEVLEFLKEEENALQRSGAIALGGLSGLVFSIRGGFFRRLVFMSLGAGGVAALCYPKEAEDYFNEGMVVVRKYGLIGHHLATSILDDLRESSSVEGNKTSKNEKE